MTGPQHYTEAERLIALATALAAQGGMQQQTALMAAQAHATLALAVATASWVGPTS